MVGLKDLHKLTSGGKYRLQVDLKGPHGFYYYYQWNKNCYVAVYDNFQVYAVHLEFANSTKRLLRRTFLCRLGQEMVTNLLH